MLVLPGSSHQPAHHRRRHAELLGHLALKLKLTQHPVHDLELHFKGEPLLLTGPLSVADWHFDNKVVLVEPLVSDIPAVAAFVSLLGEPDHLIKRMPQFGRQLVLLLQGAIQHDFPSPRDLHAKLDQPSLAQAEILELHVGVLLYEVLRVKEQAPVPDA